MRKPDFCICENKDAKLISVFVFATRIVQSLFFLNPKFQASSHLLWLYNLVCVGPGRKPRRPVFSERGSYSLHTMHLVTHSNNYVKNKMSLVVRKPVFGFSDQVRHKPICTATEDGKRLEISYIGSRGIVLSM